MQNRSYVYEYDNAGNITAKRWYAFTTGTLGTPQGVDLYSYEDSLWGDLLTKWSYDYIEYDEIGNPLRIGAYFENEGRWSSGYELAWTGRQLTSYARFDVLGIDDIDYDTIITFTYNADGIRTSKTVEGVEHRYTLSGSQIISESWEEGGVEHLLIYIYDENGSPTGLKYRTDSYAAERYNYFFFEKNLQGDIIAIYNDNGSQIGTYAYDAWGGCKMAWTSGATTLEKHIVYIHNPFRYRGYYYDVETGWYYLQSRYYNPEWGRFLNADGQLNPEIVGYNMFAYCNNNPIMGRDDNGRGWLGALIGGGVGAVVGGAFGALTAAMKGENVLAGSIAGAINGGVCGAVVGCLAEDIATCGVSSVGTATLAFAAANVFIVGAETDIVLQLVNGAEEIDLSTAIRSGAENVVFSAVSLAFPAMGVMGDIAVNYMYNVAVNTVQFVTHTICDCVNDRKEKGTSSMEIVEIYN